MTRTSTHFRTVAAAAAFGATIVMACLPGSPDAVALDEPGQCRGRR